MQKKGLCCWPRSASVIELASLRRYFTAMLFQRAYQGYLGDAGITGIHGLGFGVYWDLYWPAVYEKTHLFKARRFSSRLLCLIGSSSLQISCTSSCFSRIL